MTSFWDRTKRRAVAILAAGAAGVATAYCVYTWYTQTTPYSAPLPSPTPPTESATQTADEKDEILSNTVEQIDKKDKVRGSISEIVDTTITTNDNNNDDDDSVQPSTSKQQQSRQQHHRSSPPPVLLDPSGSSDSATLDAMAHLEHHFESIQQIAGATTLPSLLPPLSRALSASDSIDASLEKLRQAKNGLITLSPEEKRIIWEELATASVARVVASTWLLCLLSLQVRVQINVLGRHLYLETALQDPNGAMKQLSAPSQEMFLSFAEHLARVGHATVLTTAHRAAAQALQGISLDKEFNKNSIDSLLSTAFSLFAQDAFGADNNDNNKNVKHHLITELLLPSASQLREILRLKEPDDRAMLPRSHEILVDVDAVGAMIEEVGCIVGSERFMDVAFACAREVSRRAVAGLVEKVKINAVPLARLVPAIIAESKTILMPRGVCATTLGTLPEVISFCATVYSCGPPLP